MQAKAVIVQNADWALALDDALAQTSPLVAERDGVDLALVFASPAYRPHFATILERVRDATGVPLVAGCSGEGVIGPAREIEGEPALSMLVLSLPGARLRGVHVSQTLLDACREPGDWYDATGVQAEDVNAWLLFVDPFHIDAEDLVQTLSRAYPGKPLVGGLASGGPTARRTHVFLNDRAHDEGAVLVALGGEYTVHAVVSQGAEPIGEAWTITGAEGHQVLTIGMRPALDVLVETLRGLPPDLRSRAQRNLLVGLAMDEYREQFRRGDFLIRNLIGADPRTGALAVAAHPRVGQTIQFQIRDAQAADDDLRQLLARARERLGPQQPVAALLCSCNGRGVDLFGVPDHDAAAVARYLGVRDVAGFFCNGEIGPVGAQSFLHGYTASIALIVRRT
jgi:small ligand-binding sensory domain FIST